MKASVLVSMRIDKWLWVVRLFRSRTLSTEACEKGKVLINGKAVKPSRLIKESDTIQVKSPGLTRTIKVLKLIDHRVGAKLADEYKADLTPETEIENYKARTTKIAAYREPGSGRPTKRERRILDDFFRSEN